MLLSYAPCPPMPIAAFSQSSHDVKGGYMRKNILIVDDTPDLLDVLEQALIFAGFKRTDTN